MFEWIIKNVNKVRPEKNNINSNQPSFYPNSIELNKCSGSSNKFSDPYLKLCVPDVVENINKHLI